MVATLTECKAVFEQEQRVDHPILKKIGKSLCLPAVLVRSNMTQDFGVTT
jgi:hypothetical protein